MTFISRAHHAQTCGADPGPIADEYELACAKGYHDALPEIAARLHTAERAAGLTPGTTLGRRRTIVLSMPPARDAAAEARERKHRDEIMHNFITNGGV